jgi:hypothetical protein
VTLANAAFALWGAQSSSFAATTRWMRTYAVNVDSARRHYAYRVVQPYVDKHGPDYLRAVLQDQRREESFR